MTKVFTDAGNTPFEEAEMDKLLIADGSTTGVYSCWGLRIRYTGAVWEARAGFGAAAQIANVVLTWDAGNNWIAIDTSACDNPFSTTLALPYTTPDLGVTTYWTKAQQWSANETHVQFYNRDATQTVVSTEHADMDFTILWFGRVG